MAEIERAPNSKSTKIRTYRPEEARSVRTAGRVAPKLSVRRSSKGKPKARQMQNKGRKT